MLNKRFLRGAKKSQRKTDRLKIEQLERRLLLSSISLSIPSGLNTVQNGVLAVPIICNQLNTGGSGGLSQGSICVNYNSSKLSVNAVNVYEGTYGQEAASFVAISTAATSGELEVYLEPTTFGIQSVVGTGSGNITVTSPSALPAGLSNYSEVSISGVGNFPAANGVFNISGLPHEWWARRQFYSLLTSEQTLSTPGLYRLNQSGRG